MSFVLHKGSVPLRGFGAVNLTSLQSGNLRVLTADGIAKLKSLLGGAEANLTDPPAGYARAEGSEVFMLPTPPATRVAAITAYEAYRQAGYACLADVRTSQLLVAFTKSPQFIRDNAGVDDPDAGFPVATYAVVEGPPELLQAAQLLSNSLIPTRKPPETPPDQPPPKGLPPVAPPPEKPSEPPVEPPATGMSQTTKYVIAGVAVVALGGLAWAMSRGTSSSIPMTANKGRRR